MRIAAAAICVAVLAATVHSQEREPDETATLPTGIWQARGLLAATDAVAAGPEQLFIAAPAPANNNKVRRKPVSVLPPAASRAATPAAAPSTDKTTITTLPGVSGLVPDEPGSRNSLAPSQQQGSPPAHSPDHGLFSLPQTLGGVPAAAPGYYYYYYYGSYYGDYDSSGGKNLNDYSSCNVYNADQIIETCGATQPIPGCCDNDYCYTNDDASGLSCPTDAPYPACCEAVNQPTSVCSDTDRRGTCSDSSYPVPACCGTQVCEVNSDASSVKCSSGAAACCPA